MTKTFGVIFAIILIIITCGTVNAKEQQTKNITYIETNFENATKLAWAFGGYKVDDIDAVNHFLKVTECNLYNKFFENEFEWAKVVKNTKEYLTNYGKDIPRYYQFIQPITLKRYDFALKGFPLDETSVYDPTHVIQISDNKQEKNSCDHTFIASTKYPTSSLLSVSNQFALSFIHVPEIIAKEYLSFVGNQQKVTSDNRPAYIRFQVEISGLAGIQNIGTTPFFVFHGKIARIDVFADQELMLPLYTQKF